MNHITINKSNGRNILEQLGQGTLACYSPCGGNGSCGKCRIVVKGACSGVTASEREKLSEAELERGVRLACQTYAVGDVEVYWDTDMSRNDSKSTLESRAGGRLDPMFRMEHVRLVRPDIENGYTIAAVLQQAVGPRKISPDVLRTISRENGFLTEWVLTDYDGEIIDAKPGTTTGPIFGVAVDVGTTTVACYLINLMTGRQIDVTSRQNAQCVVGADVISRIQYTLERETGLSELRQKVVETIDGMIGRMIKEQGIEPSDVMQCVLVGNTTMHHIFWGLGCYSLSRIPFNAVTLGETTAEAGKVGFTQMNQCARVVFLPGVAGFVGSDTTGAMLAAGLHNAQDSGLLLDLGTNGEIVLWTRSARYACSTAAGPAFEGARIRHGMQAFAGAIDTAMADDDLRVTTIAGAPPKGICGSGLVDLVSELRKAGVIRADGRIADPSEVAEKKLADRIIQNGRQKEIVVARSAKPGSGEDIVLTQKDIRELQLAKGAIRAGINILLKVAGLSVQELDRVLLAGAFGNFIDKSSAKTIGILPNVDLTKVISLGNAAGEGAKMALCDRNALKVTVDALAFGTQHVEISSHPDFQEEFIAGMGLA